MENSTSSTPVETSSVTPSGENVSVSATGPSTSHLSRWLLIGGSLTVVVVAAVFFSTGGSFKGSFVDTNAPATGEVAPATGEIQGSGPAPTTSGSMSSSQASIPPPTGEMAPQSSQTSSSTTSVVASAPVLQLVPTSAAPGSEFHGILTGINFNNMKSDFVLEFQDNAHIKVLSQAVYGDKILKFTAKISEDAPEGPSDVTVKIVPSKMMPPAGTGPIPLPFSAKSNPLLISKAPQIVPVDFSVTSVNPGILTHDSVVTVSGGGLSGSKIDFNNLAVKIHDTPIFTDSGDIMIFTASVQGNSTDPIPAIVMTITSPSGKTASYEFKPYTFSSQTMVQTTTGDTKSSTSVPVNTLPSVDSVSPASIPYDQNQKIISPPQYPERP